MLMSYFASDWAVQSIAILVVGVVSVAAMLFRRIERSETASERDRLLALQIAREQKETAQIEHDSARKSAKTATSQ